MPGLVKKAQGLQRFMLDCGFWRSRKWVGADLAAIGLQACGISYSYEHGTDGRLPRDDLYLAFGLREKDVRNAVATLVKRGIWREVDGSYEIVGYEDHNPSQADVEEYRERKSTAGLKGNHAKWHKDKFDPLCPYCEDPSANRKPIAGAIANGSQSDRKPESQSRGEKAEENPPLSPFSQVGPDPQACSAGSTDEVESQNQEPPPEADPLLERLTALWPGRERMRAESLDVLTRCLSVADRQVVDESIGAMLAVDDKPRSPKYLLTTVRNRLVSMGAYAPNDAALEPLGAA